MKRPMTQHNSINRAVRWTGENIYAGLFRNAKPKPVRVRKIKVRK